MGAPSARHAPPAPAALQLVQALVLGRWRATGEDLYREVARLGEMAAGRDVLVSGCGAGETAEWLAQRTGAAVTGVDGSEELIAQAEQRARDLAQRGAGGAQGVANHGGTAGPSLSYEHARLDDLPHADAVFDCAVGEPAISTADDPAKAVAELARVTKPLQPVILLQLTWSSELSATARELVVERLGLRPLLLVEWKQMLRDAGVVSIDVQDWTAGGSGATPSGTSGKVPAVPSLPALTLRQKMQIVSRALRRQGLRGARGAVAEETSLLRELSHERAIGFQVLKGVKWPHETSTGSP